MKKRRFQTSGERIALQRIIVHVSASSKLLFKTIAIYIVWINPSHLLPIVLCYHILMTLMRNVLLKKGLISYSKQQRQSWQIRSRIQFPCLTPLLYFWGHLHPKRNNYGAQKTISYLLFYQKQLTKLFYLLFLDHSYVFMCRATTNQIKSGRFLSLGR